MENESLVCVDFDGGAVRTEACVSHSGQCFRFGRGPRRVPFGSIRIHADVAHVIGIRVDDVADAQRVLPHRSIGETLWPRHKPPHTDKLLGDVVLRLGI